MTKLLQIYIEGFCSIVDPVTLPLDTSGIIRVSGANGNGKTTLFSALTWGLYGKSLKSETFDGKRGKLEVNTWEKYRTSSYKGTKVSVTWVSPKGICKVIRCSNYTSKIEDDAKGGNRLLLFVEGNISPIKGKIAIQEEINRLLGLSYELFINSIMFGQGMKRLIQESNADKKKLFEDIFKLDYLNVAKNIAMEDRNHINGLYQDNLRDIHVIEGKIEDYTKARREFEKQVKGFDSLLHAEEKEYLKDINNLKSQLERVKNKIDPDITIKYSQARKRLKTLQVELNRASNLKSIPLVQLVEEVISLLTKAKYHKALHKLKSIYRAFSKSQELQSKITLLNKDVYKLSSMVREQDRYTGEIHRIKQSIEHYRLKLQNLKSRKLPNPPSSFSSTSIKELKHKLVTLNKNHKKLSKQLEDYNWLLSDPLSNNGIKAFLFDSCLGQLNDCLDKYSDILGFRIEFSMDLNSARKDFITLIERDGVIIEYGELSGGEKALVNLTMCFALHETITLSMAKSINILLLDEVFENLDRDNIELVIDLVKRLGEGKTLFLISHLENLPLGNCKNLMVSKEGGKTYYRVI